MNREKKPPELFTKKEVKRTKTSNRMLRNWEMGIVKTKRRRRRKNSSDLGVLKIRLVIHSQL
jgi:hypothetical protein